MTPEQLDRQIYLDKMADVQPMEVPIVKPNLNPALFLAWFIVGGFILGNLVVLYWR